MSWLGEQFDDYKRCISKDNKKSRVTYIMITVLWVLTILWDIVGIPLILFVFKLQGLPKFTTLGLAGLLTVISIVIFIAVTRDNNKGGW